MDPEALVVDLDDCQDGGPPQCLRGPQSGPEMEADWEEERSQRDRAIREMLSCRDVRRIKKGIGAYKRELGQLLRDQKERQLVAYDGDTRVAIAKTRPELAAELKEKGLANNPSLFIKIVRRLDDERENLRSSPAT